MCVYCDRCTRILMHDRTVVSHLAYCERFSDFIWLPLFDNIQHSNIIEQQLIFVHLLSFLYQLSEKSSDYCPNNNRTNLSSNRVFKFEYVTLLTMIINLLIKSHFSEGVQHLSIVRKVVPSHEYITKIYALTKKCQPYHI